MFCREISYSKFIRTPIHKQIYFFYSYTMKSAFLFMEKWIHQASGFLPASMFDKIL